MTRSSDLTVVIPVYNSEKTIQALCEGLVRSYGTDGRLQIVTVNDGSADGTEAACRELHHRHPDLHTHVTLSRNFGEHSAVLAGLAHARGRFCVTMDDDLQNPVEEVGRLVALLQEGYDVVYGAPEEPAYGTLRRLLSHLHDRSTHWVLGKPRHIRLSTFRAMTRFVVEYCTGFRGPSPFLDGLILQCTDRVASVTVQHLPGRHRPSGYTPGRLLSLWSDSWFSSSRVPLRWVGFLGLGLMGAAVPGLFAPTEGAPPWALLLTGLNLAALGLVGEYVGRIHLAVGGRPPYVVRQVLPESEGFPGEP